MPVNHVKSTIPINEYTHILANKSGLKIYQTIRPDAIIYISIAYKPRSNHS